MPVPKQPHNPVARDLPDSIASPGRKYTDSRFDRAPAPAVQSEMSEQGMPSPHMREHPAVPRTRLGLPSGVILDRPQRRFDLKHKYAIRVGDGLSGRGEQSTLAAGPLKFTSPI